MSRALELNFWTGTELVGGSYDDNGRRWTVALRRADGSERTMHPRHVVVRDRRQRHSDPAATCRASTTSRARCCIPAPTPTAPSGRAARRSSSAPATAATTWRRISAPAAPTSPSCSAARPTSSSIREAQKVYAIYSEGLPFEDCDLLATAMPYPVLRKAYQLSTAEMRNVDRDLLAGLESRGFKLTFGEDDTGFQMMYLRRGGGYYFNVGCSDMIVDGRIELLQYDAIERFDGRRRAAARTARCAGRARGRGDRLREPAGDRAPLHWATPSPTASARCGASTRAASCATCGRPTTQPGLWFTAGSLAQCRIYSRYLALQIKAREDKLIA